MAVDDDGWDLEPGTVLRRTEVHARFGGNRQSGIAPIANSPNVLVFTGKGGAQYGYDYDGWRSDGAFYYTGEGKLGDQKLTHGNKALATPGRRIRVFEEVQKAHVRYVGEFRTDAEDVWHLGTSRDVRERERAVIIFKLWPVDPSIAEEPKDGAPPPSGKVRGDPEALAAVEQSADEQESADSGAESDDESSGDEHLRWASDSPAEDDKLNREGLAKEIAKQLKYFAREEPKSSFLIHIDGPWGSGKSSLLNLLHRRIKDEYLVVYFDAWKHARVEPSWWALLTSLREQVVRQWSRPRRWWFRVCEAAQRARRGKRPFFATLFILAAVLLIALLYNPNLLSPKQVGALISGVKVPLTAAVAIWAATMAVSRFVWWDSARGAQRLEQVYKNPLQEVNWYFGWLVKKSKKKIVFFVDDLDRCDENHVVELLDSIQTIVRDAPYGEKSASYFVVAAHGSWLRRAYETVRGSFSGAVEDPGRRLGHLFLNKLFQLTIPMPTLGADTKQRYFEGEVIRLEPKQSGEDAKQAEIARLSEELRLAAKPEQVEAILEEVDDEARRGLAAEAIELYDTPEMVKLTEHALQEWVKFLDNNPRSMKRFVNTYIVLRAARTYEGISLTSDVLAFWLVLQTRWPILTEYFEANLNSLGTESDKKINLDALPERYDPILKDPEFRQVIREAKVELTPDRIRACCGARVSENKGQPHD
ncbi:KAP family P-loop NTPase fold protein [Saccharopolyspora endophytica]|uniref:KAP NTPase domain-containing protein n=1 Tax=Saccharopolyspora endophytica TaxID=543886 RepID=A0ABS5DI26_9PSEU|nr:P-loop NTPase fold protein [Saccharopolyspora endophytica]MBQ0925945.1 hypothetical protein [Saccharopolyspora endophytica]